MKHSCKGKDIKAAIEDVILFTSGLNRYKAFRVTDIASMADGNTYITLED